MITAFLSTMLFGQADTLMSTVSKWQNLEIIKDGSLERRNLMSGEAYDLENLTVFAETIPAGAIAHPKKHSDLETLIIIKDGQLRVTVKDQTKLLGPGSVALIYPGDEYSFENSTDKPVTYYVFEYKAKIAVDLERGEKAGGSFMIDWNDLEYKPSDIGGRRDYFHRATAMFNNFEMHVSTLNEGLTNHAAHTHEAEEFVVMIKGDVVMLIGEENYGCSTGDVVFISSMVPHSLNNTGKGETMYFAFQFWQ